MESKIESSETFSNISEKDVGITEYMNPDTPPIKCILKHRFSDFIVNEIDINGNVIWIKEKEDNINNNSGNVINEIEKEKEEKKEKHEMTEEEAIKIINEKFKGVISEKSCELLEKFVINFVYKLHKINDSFNVEYIDNKQKRTEFHELIRNNFPFLDSETCEYKEKKEKFIKITYISKSNFYRRRKIIPDKNKSILHFTMLKRNIDTGGALTYLSRHMHRNPKLFGFAGNKDKRGITTQRVSILNALPNEVLAVVNNKKLNIGIEISNFTYKDSPLKLGELYGNQFSVVLRFVEMNGDINSSISSLSNLGFVNYFGMQRFGNTKIPTHYIGILVIKKEYKEVFMSLLNSEDVIKGAKAINIDNVRDIFDSDKYDKEKQMKIIGDIMKVVRKSSIEYRLLEMYKKNGINSFKNSFFGLSKQLQVLYPHAYQSYIWNKAVSYRIQKHGRKLIIGDIVKKKGSEYKEQIQEENINGELDEIICGDNNNIENKDKKTKGNEKVKINFKEEYQKLFNENFEYITEENISKYDFFDLVIPIVGNDILYPKNDVKDYIENMLKKDGIQFKDLEYESTNFNASGYYRNVVAKPINGIKFDILKFDEQNEDLQTPYYNIKPHPNPNGSIYTALRLIFQLRQSTYATMLFRELTKNSSDFNTQTEMSKKIKEK